MHKIHRPRTLTTIATMTALLCAAGRSPLAAAGAGQTAGQSGNAPIRQTQQTTAQSAGQTPAQGAGAATPSGPNLPLSIDEAVSMALESNLGLKAERLNLDIASESIALAKSAFLPQVSGSLGRQRSRFLPSDFTQGTSDISTTGVTGSAAFGQNLPGYAGNYVVSWSGSRFDQIGGLSSINPRDGSTLQMNFTQPLVRGFKTDASRATLSTTRLNHDITDINLRQRIVVTEATVRLAYLNLVGAIEGKKVAEKNMSIAQQSLEQSKARVNVGQSAQIEIIQSEAQVASNEEQLIIADAQIGTAEDQLRSLILDPSRPDYWEVHLMPTDTIRLTPRDIDPQQVIKNALENRLDLLALKHSIEITDFNLSLGKNNTLPAVDLALAYSSQGTAGTQYEFGSGFPPPIIGRSDRPWSNALADTFLGQFPTWSLGVNVSYPLGRTSQEVTYAQTQITKRQQELNLQDLQLQIVGQVRDAVRQVTNSFQRVQATGTFRHAAELQLEAEEKRFAVSMSTVLDLQVRQTQLATALVAELNAIIDYNRALIVLDRVQKTR
jgi:outer membrane protein TolC